MTSPRFFEAPVTGHSSTQRHCDTLKCRAATPVNINVNESDMTWPRAKLMKLTADSKGYLRMAIEHLKCITKDVHITVGTLCRSAPWV